jgi:23S rRNA (adenine2503-C2)-methyltransferase
MGFVRHLDAGEIVAQVLVMMRRLGPERPQAVSIVFMGMGEPLHNLDNVARAVRILCHPAGLGLSPNRITVSTAGVVPGIDRLASMGEPRPLLALSLNAVPGATRSRLMPIDKTFDNAALRAALTRWPLRAGEKITIEYVLLAGTNDSDRDADALADWISDLRHNVNLIPFNRWDGAPFSEPDEARIQSFARRLSERGCLVTIRRSRGRDASAACGQLVSRVPRGDSTDRSSTSKTSMPLGLPRRGFSP